MNVASGVKLAPGSGRTMHVVIPAYDASRASGGALAVTGTARQGTPVASAATLTASGTGTTTYQAAAQGAIPIRIRAAAGTDLAGVQSIMTACPILDRLAVNPVLWPAQVYRFICMARFTAIAAVGAQTDYGLSILPVSSTSMDFQGTNRAGIKFGPIDANTFQLAIRRVAAGAYTLQRNTTFVAAGVADITKLHQYEMRILSADATNNALLKIFIDGNQIGAAVDLGSTAAIAPAIDANGSGWRFGLFNASPSASPCDIFVTEMHTIVSASEDDAG